MHATATLSCLSVCDRKSRSQSMDWGALHPSHSPQWYHSPCLASSTLPSSLAARRGHIRLASGLQGRARAGAQDTDSIVAWPRVLLSGSSRLETHATIGALICTWPTSAGMSLPMSISLILANRVKRQKGGRDFEGTPLHHYGNSPEESYNGPSRGQLKLQKRGRCRASHWQCQCQCNLNRDSDHHSGWTQRQSPAGAAPSLIDRL